MAGGSMTLVADPQQGKKLYFTKKTRRAVKRQLRRNKLISFSKAPMPNNFGAKLRYAETFTIDPGTVGVAGVHVFSANGLYDPNITGVGHQPRGFDQLMTMYDHYTVVGSKITATFSTAGIAGAGGPLLVGVAVKDSDSVYTDKNDYMEGRNVVSRVLDRSAVDNESHSLVLKKAYSTRKFLGISKPLSNSLIRGTSGANPSEQAYFHLFSAIVTGTADAPVIEVSVVIDYLVVFTEPKQPSQS